MALPCDDHKLTPRCAFKKNKRINTPVGSLPLREYQCHYCYHITRTNFFYGDEAVPCEFCLTITPFQGPKQTRTLRLKL